MNLEIIFEDNAIILCRKPAGVATQTKRLGQQDMESLLKNYRAKKGEQPYIGVVHRLDQPVEGLMVFAKNQKATAGLSKQIQQHMIGKHYYAMSNYCPEKLEGVLENYLLTDKKTNYTQVVDELEVVYAQKLSGAKKAKLEYTVIRQSEAGTLFDILLHTGRQHQIRVQMAHMGCPLIGDEKYGATMEQGEGVQKPQLALCSYRLEFVHPITGKKMDYSIWPEGASFQCTSRPKAIPNGVLNGAGTP